MAPKDRNNYFKLVTLMIDIACSVLWKYITENILGATSFGSFLDTKQEKHKLVHLFETNRCCQCTHEKKNRKRAISRNQLLKLYESDKTKQIRYHKCYKKPIIICICNYSAQKNVDIKDVDITLANYIIRKCGKHQPEIYKYMEQIKDLRDEIFHLSDIQEITDNIFSRLWTKLEGSIVGLAKSQASEYANKIEKDILQIKGLTFIPDYMLKYEKLCRDYWEHKCVEFEVRFSTCCYCSLIVQICEWYTNTG